MLCVPGRSDLIGGMRSRPATEVARVRGGDRVLGVISTALSGASNLVVQLLVAAFVSTTEFASFSIVGVTLLFALGIARVSIGQVDLVRGLPGPDHGPVTTAWVASAMLLLGGAAMVALGSLVGPMLVDVGWGIVAAAVFVLQDAARFRTFRVGRPGLAATSDLLILVVSVGGVLAAAATGMVSEWALAVWTGATLIGFVVIAIPLRFWPDPRRGGGRAWGVTHRDLIVPGVGEFALSAALPYALNWVVLALGGPAALAGFRLMQLIFAGISNLAQGISATSIPSVVDIGSPRHARRLLGIESTALLGVGVVATVFCLAIPSAWGVAAFGATWLAALAYLVPCAIQGIVNAVSFPIVALLRILGFATFSLYVRIATVPLIAVLVFGGTALLGAPGVAWGLAAAHLVALAVRGGRVHRSLSRLAATGDSLPRRSS